MRTSIVDYSHSTSHSTLYVQITWGGSKSQFAPQGSSFQKSNASHVTLRKRVTPSSSLAWLTVNRSHSKPYVQMTSENEFSISRSIV